MGCTCSLVTHLGTRRYGCGTPQVVKHDAAWERGQGTGVPLVLGVPQCGGNPADAVQRQAAQGCA